MKHGITIIIVFLSIAGLSAPESRLTWKPVSEARGYYIEIRDSGGKYVIRKNIRRNYYDVSKLEPGKYTFRIATQNIAKKKGESTDWMTFIVEKLVAPELKKVSPSEILINNMVKEIRIEGKNFNSESRFFLRRPGYEIQIKNLRILSENEALISFDSKETMKGLYDLAVVNRGGAEDVLRNAVNIVESEKIKTKFFAAAGYTINIPQGVWADYFSTSYTGGAVYLQFSAERCGYKNFLLESSISAASYSSTSTTQKRSLIYFSSGLGAGYYYPAKTNLSFFLKILTGPAYNVLTYDKISGAEKTTSIDIFVMPAAGVRYYAGDRFFIEPALSWNTVFTAESFFHSLGISIYAGIVF